MNLKHFQSEYKFSLCKYVIDWTIALCECSHFKMIFENTFAVFMNGWGGGSHANSLVKNAKKEKKISFKTYFTQSTF